MCTNSKSLAFYSVPNNETYWFTRDCDAWACPECRHNLAISWFSHLDGMFDTVYVSDIDPQNWKSTYGRLLKRKIDYVTVKIDNSRLVLTKEKPPIDNARLVKWSDARSTLFDQVMAETTPKPFTASKAFKGPPVRPAKPKAKGEPMNILVSVGLGLSGVIKALCTEAAEIIVTAGRKIAVLRCSLDRIRMKSLLTSYRRSLAKSLKTQAYRSSIGYTPGLPVLVAANSP